MPLVIPAQAPAPPQYVPVVLPSFRVVFITATTQVTLPAVSALTTLIGRSSTRFDGAGAGSAQLVANDNDRLVDVNNAAGPLFGQLIPGGPTTVQVSCLVPTIGYVPLYTGLIATISHNAPDGDQRLDASITLGDAQRDLTTHIAAAGKIFPEAQSGAMIRALFGAPSRSGWGWINRAPTGLVAIDDGCQVMGAITADGSTNTWTYGSSVAADEEGLVFFDQGGVPTFQGRQHRSGQTTPLWVFGDGPGEIPVSLPDLQYLLPSDRLVADVAIATTDGGVSVYGPAGASTMTTGGTSSTLASRFAGASRASSFYRRFSQARQDVPTVTIDPLSDFPQLGPTSRFYCAMFAKVGDLVTVNRRPAVGAMISRNYFIDAIKHTRTAGDTWMVTFTVVFADTANTGWRLGTDYTGPLSPSQPKLGW